MNDIKKYFPLFRLMSVFALCVAILILSFKKDHHQYRLSILAIFQNEERFLKEWIDFHRLLGVEHFYLFNHLSTDSYLKVLQPYIQTGLVELFDWPYESQLGNEADWVRIQSAAYRAGFAKATGQTKWLAMIDTDEFIFPQYQKNIPEFLNDYEDCSGILINWQVFGTSGVKRISEDSLMIEQLILQSPPQHEVNTYCKSIVRPEKVKYCNDPHTVIYYPWTYAVDPDKKIFPWKFHASRPVKLDKIRINHYWSRDEEFFYKDKLARYEKWGNIERREACLKRNDLANQILNTDIHEWIPALRQ